MNITLEDINLYIPKEVTDKLPRKKFYAGELLIKREDKHIIFLLSGVGHLIRYQNDKKTIFPFVYKTNTIVGFNMLFSSKMKNWEFISNTDGEAIIFSSEVIEKYIYNNPHAFKFFVESTVHIVEGAINNYYILAHGGAKACLAFLFIEGAENNVFSFKKYENFSEALGVSKTMLYRITKSLVDEKLIKKDKRHVTILDSEGLKKLYKEYIYS